MYGLNRVFTAGAPYLVRSHSQRLNPSLGSFALRHSSAAAVDDFVYLEKGYKICRKTEIEGAISNTDKLTSFEKGLLKQSYKRKVLPPELMSNTVVRLTCESAADGGICDVYLVGTVHNDETTWQQTQTVIRHLQPQVVFLELCSDRVYVITRQFDEVPTMGEMVDMWEKNEHPLRILFKWFDAKIGSRIGKMQSGGEVRVAYKEAMEYGGKVILGDLPHEITTRKILSKMSVWRYLFQPAFVPIPEDLRETAKCKLDVINLQSQGLIKNYPAYWGPMIHERDLYMSAKLLEVARKHNSVVAIVGVGHLAGIQKNWKQPVDIKQLLDTGTDRCSMGKMLNSIGAMAFYLSLSNSQIEKIKNFLSIMLYKF